MDYEAEDKEILRKITTEALSRVMSTAERNDMRAYNLRVTETNADEVQLAIQGASILYRESCTDWSRHQFYNLECLLRRHLQTLKG